MDKERLRTTSNFNEITSVIREACANHNPVMIWQNPIGAEASDEERIIANGKMTFFNSNQVTITIELDDAENVSLDLNHVIYISSDEFVLLFKSDMDSLEGSKITVQVPREMKLLERRLEPRTDIPAESRFKVELKLEKKVLSATLLNLSKGGAAILIESNTHIWSVGDHVHIRTICDVQLPHSLHAEVRNIRDVELSTKKTSSKAIRVGLQFKQKLGPEDLKSILDKLPKNLTND